MLDDVLEEQSILWSDDLGFVLTLVIRTISNMRQSHADVKMLPEFKSDEDAEFVKTLFEKTLINYNERLEYIEKFTRNWDVERIVFMDNLIMATAITELVSFPSIPGESDPRRIHRYRQILLYARQQHVYQRCAG